MRYQHLKTYKKLRAFLIPVVPVLIATILIFTKTEAPLFATNAVHVIAKPLWEARATAVQTAGSFFSFFSDTRTLVDQNKALKEEIIRLSRETFSTRSLAHENERLLTLLGRMETNPERHPASVLHGNTFSPYDTFFIDQGTKEGVRENMLVLTPENIAVGSVTTVLDHTAIVTRFSASGFSNDVLLGATSTVHANLQGIGSGTMVITVPRDIETTIGDIVTLPSFKTYTIGTVVSIEVAPEDAFKLLFITSPVNMYELRYVLIDTTSVWNIHTEKEDQQPEEEKESDNQEEEEEEPETP